MEITPPSLTEIGSFVHHQQDVCLSDTESNGSDALIGIRPHPTAWDKAAALLHSFYTTQSLLDGNKRTGWAACWLFLRLNLAVGPLLGEVDADAAERLVLKIANKKIEISEIAGTLRSLVTPLLGNVDHLPPRI
ncbi:Fic family protein [Corynebacterium sp. KPL2861]|uniref:type II toxin-antitoxin system death-on-curing family toxin n=1 Tax=unclassified Corynebacterium TaxID=2624378 RepID=UPI0012EC42DD